MTREKEEAAASKKRKQAVMDEILTASPKKSAESSMKDTRKSGPKELDAKTASYFYVTVCSPRVLETGPLTDTSRRSHEDPQQAEP